MKKQIQHEKYDSTNPIAQMLINGFMQSIETLVMPIANDINQVTECGCGQGHVNQVLERLLPDAEIRGFDIDAGEVEVAQSNKRRKNTQLFVKSIYNLDQEEQADLVVCCEVLEHLEQPELALKKMASLQADYYLFSVPREPIWRMLNFMRGKYIKDWGNTPDHCNHWSTRKFKHFVATELDIIHVNTPLPWTMILAKPKSK